MLGTILEKNYLKTKGNIITYSWSAYKELSHKISGHLFEAIDYYLKLSEDFTPNQLKDIIILIPEIEEHRIKQCIKAIKYKYKEEYHHKLSSAIIFGRPSIVNCNKLILCDGILPAVSALICKELELWLCSKDNLWVINKLRRVSFKELILKYKEEIHVSIIPEYHNALLELGKTKQEKFNISLDNTFTKNICLEFYQVPKNIEERVLIYITGNCRSLADLKEYEEQNTIKDIIDAYPTGCDLLLIGTNHKDNIILQTLIVSLKKENSHINIEIIEEDNLPVKDFHNRFDTYLYTPTEKNWDCSSRLIRECQAYGKDIIFTKNSLKNIKDNHGLKYLVNKFKLVRSSDC